jgi:hypothetical protein
MVFKKIEMVPGTRRKQLHFEVHDSWLTDDVWVRLENWERVRQIKKRVKMSDVLGVS